ncbi:MAG: antitoxin family protein [Candidatus Latescibacterota bacterium]
MRRTVEAIFENGVFRPISPPALPEGQPVRLEVEELPCPSADELLDLAAQVYSGLSQADIQAVEGAMRRRADFFGENPA